MKSESITNYQLPMIRQIVRCLALFVTLCLLGCQAAESGRGKQVQVIRVMSGQTVEIADPQTNKPLQVRLLGIDAPDLKQEPWGRQAKQRLEELVGGQFVMLESDLEPSDRFDRQLGYLWIGSELANEKLIEEGYVLAASRAPNLKYQQRLTRAQQWSRLMGRGIWNAQMPLRQTPSEFRQSVPQN
jgi:micrococcal nuclease